MYVITRSGKKEDVHFDKINERITKLCFGLNREYVDPNIVTKKTIQGMFDGITTEALDNLSAEVSAYLSSVHPDYSYLAARIVVANLHRNTEEDFYKLIERMFLNRNRLTDFEAPLVSSRLFEFVREHRDVINENIRYEKDFAYDYFGFKTLERSYLLKIDNKIIERPQHMLMRVSLGIHIGDIEQALKTYHLMSDKWFTHASPTLFNAGTPRAQMSSCFLLTMKDDSIEGIYETLKQCALISQSAGGIGVAIHDIRAKGTFIRGTNGNSNGIVPMLRVFNDTARYVDQGGGKRKGAFAIYLEPWHADIFDFLELKKNHGKEELRARDLFYALWVSDLFMKRIESDDMWSLFCPHECPGLSDAYGDKFEALYHQYEQEGRARRKVKARDLWFEVINAQIETGSPYILYKDSANEKSNQKNLGTIRSSNLCTEILEYTSAEEVAVCNLASIALPRFVENGVYDFKKLYDVTYQVTLNLNKIIDENFYPVPEAKYSNLKNRPIGIGVQGLADAFFKLRLPFESEGAAELNRDIFETLYFASLSASVDLAKKDGPYDSYEGSPISKGQLQFDMWGVKPSNRWNWNELRAKIKKFGVRNSLLLAPMPTASTSQILGNTECIEPITSNIYTRRVLSGEFAVVNKYLVDDLIRLNLWSTKMKDVIVAHNGSIQEINEIPQELKDLYKTVWEVKQKNIIDLAAKRAPFIDQSQSLNIHMIDPNFGKLSSMHFYAWKAGLKTGMYYLRTKSAVDSIKFTIKPEDLKISANADELKSELACSLDNPEDCISCGS